MQPNLHQSLIQGVKKPPDAPSSPEEDKNIEEKAFLKLESNLKTHQTSPRRY